MGAGLSVVGALLQTVTRNDLADPFVFGLSSGAAAGAVSVITLFGDRLGLWTLPMGRVRGGVARSRHGPDLDGQWQWSLDKTGWSSPDWQSPFLFGSVTSYLVFSGDQRAASSILFWSVGGLGTASWSNLPLAAAGTAFALLAGLIWHRPLDALLGGDDTALSLGIDANRLRRRVFLLCAVTTAALVALSGVIGFVGMMIPHLARSVAGVRHAPLLVTSALFGAAMMLTRRHCQPHRAGAAGTTQSASSPPPPAACSSSHWCSAASCDRGPQVIRDGHGTQPSQRVAGQAAPRSDNSRPPTVHRFC